MANDHSDDRTSSEESRLDISSLASAVLSVLSDKGEEGVQTIRSSVVQKLVDAALKSGSFDSEALLEELKDCRISTDQIVDVYIPQAACELGQMWCDDDIGFAKVTIATARLQGLLTLLAPPWVTRARDSAKDGTNILMLLQGNDSHTLGPHVATSQLRRFGASVRILFGPKEDTVVRALSEESYDLVLFSSSRAEALASVAKMAKRVRTSILVPPPLVLGGIILNLADGVKEKTGVDLVTNDVKVALKLCEKNKSRSRFLMR